ncbi:thioredoxin domain-containing protein [Microbacterium sp. SD291]|uniref:DsbA family protein n=1 Tax=Microbacterium sp. SD291 TaxID=2782007 RepID=UPI001A979E80|nr:thioredoxin domain-containing protein [Microbacterium sp. SD291]MBO0981887.1 thioredoxin domain-containing protein [Microbacterium sp. SD291]
MKSSLKVTLITIATVIALVTGAIIYTIATRPKASTDDNAAALTGARANSHVLDSAGPDAPTLVEFLDFECEACGAFYPYVEDIRNQYDGQINYVFRYYPIPSHYNSMNAALAVEAAAQQDRVEEMYHRMFETQTEWGEQRVPAADLFRSFAEDLGLDMDLYDEAVADPATRGRVEEDFVEGQQMGVQGTPTFFLDGERLELNQLTDLTDALDRALAD